MPRTVESATSKLLRLIEDLSPDEIRFAKEILTHAERRDREAKKRIDGTGPKRRKRTPPAAPSVTEE